MTWIWTATAWTLTAAGVALFLYAAFWDRPGRRGRPARRCRKCWYDLTANPAEPTREHPITCPECGRKHATIRAMRKTRRRKWGIVLSGLVLIGAYTASVWPRVSRYNYAEGWVGAIPTPILVLCLPLLDNDSGSYVDRNSGTIPLPPQSQRPIQDRIAYSLKTRLYDAERTTALSHQLFVAMAKADTPETLTDPTSIRGQVWRYVFQAWDRQERLSSEEERWACEVHHLKIRHAEFWIENSPAFANIRIRRLLDRGKWRVRIHHTLYEAVLPKDWRLAEGYKELVPVDLQTHAWWDGNACIFDERYRNSGVFGGTPPTTFSRRVDGRIYDGDQFADIWWPVARINETIEFKIAAVTWTQPSASSGKDTPDSGGRIPGSIEGYKVIYDAAPFVDWLRKAAKVSFVGENGDFFPEPSLPHAITLSIRDPWLQRPEVPPFTFGGSVRLVIEKRDGGRYGADMAPTTKEITVMNGDPVWWALRSEKDDDGKHLFEGAWKRVPMRYGARSHVETPFYPQLSDVAINDEVVGGYIEISFYSPDYGWYNRAMADLSCDQLLTEQVRIPLGHSEAQTIGNALRSSKYRMGSIEEYTPDELAEIEAKYDQRTWLRRGTGSNVLRGSPAATEQERREK